MPPRNRIAEILVKAGIIDELQLRSALAQHEQWGTRLARVVTEMGITDEDTIAEAIGKGLSVPRVRLGNLPKDAGALAKLDVAFAEEKAIFPVSLKDNGKTLALAMADPTDLALIDEVARRSRTRVVPLVAGEKEISNAILRHYRGLDPTPEEAGRKRSRPAAASLPDEDGESGDFKVTDMSGKTLIRKLDPRIVAEAAAPIARASAPPPRPSPAQAGGAADMLDELLGGSAPSGFTEEELQRIQLLKQNQEKSGIILQALSELLAEKGLRPKS